MELEKRYATLNEVPNRESSSIEDKIIKCKVDE